MASQPSFRDMLDALPMAIYVTDQHGKITYFNPACVAFSGRTPELGSDHWCVTWKLFHPDGTPMPHDQCPMAIALKEGRIVHGVEAIAERPDGTRVWLEPYPTPLRDQAGQIVGGINMLIDTTERKRAFDAQARLAAIIESSDDAIISKDLNGIIKSWNNGAERIFGYSAEEAIGQSVTMLMPPERVNEEPGILERIRRGEKIDHYETVRRRKDGTLLDISLTVSPVFDRRGRIIGASKIARDITERKRSEEARERFLAAEREAREEAQRVNRLKDEFLATLSHELRTPLNAVMGWAQILASGHMRPEEMREAGQIIERNARMQKQLIDDLLDMSRILSGKLRLEVQRVEPMQVIEAAIETVQPSADAKLIRIEKVLDPTAGPVSGDPARLQQVVWNLLSNSIKFTPKGGRVQVLLERVNSHIELTISDTGEGIKPDFLPQLFSRFSQADASTNRKHGGLGLGLAIVKQLVELHGGSVRAKSAGEGLGASFIIHLPILILKHDAGEERVHPKSPSAIPMHLEETDLSGLHVLVVDDEPDALDLIRRLLTDMRAKVTTAKSAREALRLVEQSPPQVLISDIGMPEIDGYEFLRMVRKLKDATASRIPAIALTAFARSEDRTRALRAGYIAHVAKPVEPSELLATVAVVAERHEKA